MSVFPAKLPNGQEAKPIGALSGITIPSYDTSLHLLPLLRPAEKQLAPPLHLLPGGSTSKERIAFQTQSATWVSTSHVYPSAYPRSHPMSTVTQQTSMCKQPEVDRARLTMGTDKDKAKKLRAHDIQQGVERMQHISVESTFPPTTAEEANERARELAQQGQPLLWCSAQRIAPVRRQSSPAKKTKGLTLVLYHANGFHKEIWEPMLHRMVEQLEEDEQRSSVHVEEIWSVDHFNSGEAGVLNRGKLGSAMPWFDHARDLQQFVQHYLPSPSTVDELAMYGPRWPPTQLNAQSTPNAGRKGRQIIGISHSIGGAAMTMAALASPNLLDGIIAVDPMIGPIDALEQHPIPSQNANAFGAFARADVFASTQDVVKYMDGRAYFQAWDPRVRTLHATFGFSPLDAQQGAASPLSLSMSKWSEGFSFAHEYTNTWAMREIRDKLPSFDGWIDYLYSQAFSEQGVSLWSRSSQTAKELFAKANAAASSDRRRRRRPAPPFSVEFLQGNHLLVQEEPDRMGVKVAKNLIRRLAGSPSTVPKARM